MLWPLGRIQRLEQSSLFPCWFLFLCAVDMHLQLMRGHSKGVVSMKRHHRKGSTAIATQVQQRLRTVGNPTRILPDLFFSSEPFFGLARGKQGYRRNTDPNEHAESSHDADSNPCFDEIPEDNPGDELDPWVDYMK